MLSYCSLLDIEHVLIYQGFWLISYTLFHHKMHNWQGLEVSLPISLGTFLVSYLMSIQMLPLYSWRNSVRPAFSPTWPPSSSAFQAKWHTWSAASSSCKEQLCLTVGRRRPKLYKNPRTSFPVVAEWLYSEALSPRGAKVAAPFWQTGAACRSRPLPSFFCSL